ncbi:hypothetical protein BC832DRAFT_567445 [Gaertneriomyces semiglobifer]|nr:hypothetical protein BC832DRAFT_567445 [Gaertneriomyces semiglobifer]
MSRCKQRKCSDCTEGRCCLHGGLWTLGPGGAVGAGSATICTQGERCPTSKDCRGSAAFARWDSGSQRQMPTTESVLLSPARKRNARCQQRSLCRWGGRRRLWRLLCAWSQRLVVGRGMGEHSGSRGSYARTVEELRFEHHGCNRDALQGLWRRRWVIF